MTELVLTARPLIRVVAVIVGAASIGLTGWALVVSDIGGLMVVPFLTGWMAAAAIAGLRLSVRADASGLHINSGFRTQLVEWDRVRGFRAVDRRGLRGVYVLVDDDDVIRLPFENLGRRMRRRALAEDLRECARHYQAGRP